MPAIFDFILVDESTIPRELPREWTDSVKQIHLAKMIRAGGAFWGQYESDPNTFYEVLSVIDTYLGSTRVLPVYGFNYSPHKLLDLDAEHPRIGYYKPALVKDLDALLRKIEGIIASDAEEARKVESLMEGEVEQVLHLLEEAFSEAAKRDWGVAILHTW